MTERFVKTGVIGHPVSHSKSPQIHSYWIDKYGLSGSYEAIDIHPKKFKQGVLDLINQGFIGFNVTVPHKVAIMDLCDQVDDIAQTIGAVNTVTIKSGKLHGTNTDAFGFIENLKQKAPEGWNLQGKKALILGAGGAALAVIYALRREGVSKIIICNRTQEKAEKLSTEFGGNLVAGAWSERDKIATQVDLIVNTTSLGMAKQPALEMDLKDVHQETVIYDIVYTPLITDLLARAQMRGLHYVTGIGMLLHQARPGFKLWHGVLPDVTPELENSL